MDRLQIKPLQSFTHFHDDDDFQPSPSLEFSNYTILEDDDDPGQRFTNQTSRRPRGPYTADEYLWMYLSPVILVLGLCGNTLTLIVMNRKRLRGTTTSIYMPAMAIADTVALTAGIIPEWMEACRFSLFSELNSMTCRLEKWIFYSFSDTAIWILVLFTFDRFIAVCFPLKKRLICVPVRSKILCVVTLGFALLKNFHVFWTRGPSFDLEGKLIKMCDRPKPYDYFEFFVRPWLAFSVVSVLPFFMLSFCNCTIIYQITRITKIRMDKSKNEKAFAQTTMMCLSASFAFLVCVTPSMVMHIGKAYWVTKNNFQYDVAKTISNLLSYLSHAINFFLYCITGAKFRRELVLMFVGRHGVRAGLEEITNTHTTYLSNGRRFTNASMQQMTSRPTVKRALNDVTAQVMSTVSAHMNRYPQTEL